MRLFSKCLFLLLGLVTVSAYAETQPRGDIFCLQGTSRTGFSLLKVGVSDDSEKPVVLYGTDCQTITQRSQQTLEDIRSPLRPGILLSGKTGKRYVDEKVLGAVFCGNGQVFINPKTKNSVRSLGEDLSAIDQPGCRDAGPEDAFLVLSNEQSGAFKSGLLPSKVFLRHIQLEMGGEGIKPD